MSLRRRLALLEVGHRGGELSPSARKWLGLPVTEAELAAEVPFDPATVDRSGWSKELKTWLGLV